MGGSEPDGTPPRDEGPLSEIADRIADGEPVAWESGDDGPPTTPLIEHLRALERLGQAFRGAAGHARAPSDPESWTWGHLRVRAPLGEGSFGEVFRAHDTVLDRDVALKLSKRAFGPDTERRFLEEARRLARVRHPNVVTVYGADVSGGRVGLWTDLVDGETLESLLQRQGPLSAREAALIGLDLCGALAAVHVQGLVHGDVKAANVMRERGGRIVLMDFGTVKELPRHGGEPVVTRGTPLVLAPELLRGQPPTPASDLYSLGVLLYRLVTGRHPVEGDDVLEIARKHARGEWTPLRDVRPDLPDAFVRTVEQALAPDPARRYASAGVMERALASVAAEPKRRGRPSRAALAAGAAVLAAVAGILAVARLPGHAPGSSPAAARRSVAVLGFKNLSGRADAAWLSTALAEMLTTELASSERLRTVSSESVARARVDLALDPAEPLTVAALRQLRRHLGADLLGVGSYVVLGDPPDRVRVDVRLQDAETGETVLAASETGTQADLFDLVTRTGTRLRARLGSGGPAGAAAVRASLPAGRDAARLYVEGLERLRLFDAPAARALLEKAVALEPGFALGHSALSTAWSTLGHDARARAQAAQAFELSAGLPQQDRLFVEARFREAAREWDSAIAAYRSLVALAPDEVEYGLRLAGAQTAASRSRDALATMESLRRLPPPASEDPRIDLAEAVAAASLGEDRRAQAAAARAAEKGTVYGARLLVARARVEEGQAWRRLGQAPLALQAAAEARSLFGALRDPLGTAHTLNLEATLLYERGELGRARAGYERTLAIHRDLGHGAGTAAALANIGLVLQQQGDLAQAEAQYEQSLALSRELGDRRREAARLGDLGLMAWRRGNAEKAKRLYEGALAISREVGYRRGVSSLLNNIAVVLRARGELGEALRRFEESLEIAREIGDLVLVVNRLFNIADVHRIRGRLDLARPPLDEALAVARERGDREGTARSLFGQALVLTAAHQGAAARGLLEEALAIRLELGQKGYAGDVKTALADLALDDGRNNDAATLLRAAVEEFQREGRLDDEAMARVALGRAQAAGGEAAAARESIARGLELASRSQSVEVRLTAAIPAQRLRATSGPPAAPCGAPQAKALQAIQAAAAEAARLGFVELELAARLAQGDAEMRCGRAREGRARLSAVARDARPRGLARVADEAERLSASSPATSAAR
jgi:tetratricopeptide (TPR) repeat protein/TolB-like protein